MPLDLVSATGWLQTNGLRILIITLAAVLLGWALGSGLSRLERRLQSVGENGEPDRQRRTRTLVGILRNLGLGLIALVAVLMILAQLGFDTSPLLASAGLLGLALGLGAQTLVRDVIGGVFILAEEQFHLGDVVRVGEITGTVERMTLRATYLRDLDGALHLVPNGEVRIVSNLSRGWSRALVDVAVPNDRDTDRALALLEVVCRQAADDPLLAAILAEPPLVAGVEALDAASVRLRIYAKTLPGKQWEAARALRRLVKDRFDAEGITQTLPGQVYLRQSEH